MKTYRVDEIPLNFNFDFTSMELDAYELSKIEEVGAEVVFYWYAYGHYEGAGQIIFKIGNKWYLYDASHCSCYGPTDHIEESIEEGYASLDEILTHCSNAYKEEIMPLIRLAKEKGYK